MRGCAACPVTGALYRRVLSAVSPPWDPRDGQTGLCTAVLRAVTGLDDNRCEGVVAMSALQAAPPSWAGPRAPTPGLTCSFKH